MARFTKKFIDSRPLPEKDYKAYWDGGEGGIKGFGLRVRASGRKTFLVFSRLHGRNITVTIGQYGVFTVEQAREEAKDILRDMSKGIDPRHRKQTEQVTLRQVADAYLARPGKLKNSSKGQIERHVSKTFKAWENRPIASISEKECRDRYRQMLTGGLHGDRKGGSNGQANQALAILRALINYAMRNYRNADGTPVVTFNPVQALKDDWMTLKERNSYIPAARIGHVWNLLNVKCEEAYSRAELSGVDLVRFLLLTGCRIGEASALTWDRVNLDEAWWHLPDPKNRNPIWLPLSEQAVTLLEQRPRINRYVFPGIGRDRHIKDPRALWEKISKVAGETVSAHDMRRSFTNYGVRECDIDLHKIELLTGHKLQGVTAKHYLDTQRLTYLLPEVQQIADFIEQKAEQASGANVIPLAAKKG